MHHNEINELNKALKGEHMAIESFDHYIQDTKDETLKKNLQDMQQQHKFHAIQISERIQQLNGNPVNTSGLSGAMAEVWFRVMPQNQDDTIVRSAVEGEEFGIQAYGDIMAKISDDANKKLMHEMLMDNIRIVEQLNTHLQ